jgi:hypothetical protein
MEKITKTTYGWEIEFIDAQRSVLLPQLPLHCSFSKREITLINSNGLAVDSGLGAAHDWGGEINTPPIDTMEGAINLAKSVFRVLEENGATSNYRCNTQFHIGIVGWEEWSEQAKLKFLKKAQKFFYENAKEILDLTMGETNFIKQENYLNSFWGHHQELPIAERKHEALMKAKTVKDFQNAFFLTEKGNYHFANFQRQYVNVHQMFKTGTIEFRNFYNVKNEDHFTSIAMFCEFAFFNMLLDQKNVVFQNTLKKAFRRDEFPFRDPYLPELEEAYQKTRVKSPTTRKNK